MKTKQQEHKDVLIFFTKLSLQIIILFAICIGYSFITEYLQASGFFGDTLLEKPDVHSIDEKHDWGTRHCLFFWMSIILFLIQLVRVIVFAIIEGGYTFLSEQERLKMKY